MLTLNSDFDLAAESSKKGRSCRIFGPFDVPNVLPFWMTSEAPGGESEGMEGGEAQGCDQTFEHGVRTQQNKGEVCGIYNLETFAWSNDIWGVGKVGFWTFNQYFVFDTRIKWYEYILGKKYVKKMNR